MFQLPPSSYKTLSQFKNVPPIINPTNIQTITDIDYLLDLENTYNVFLERNLQLLDLHNIIEDLLDIRDTISIQICRIKRAKEIYEYNKTQQEQKKSIQAHTGLNLTKNQKDQGYILCQNSLKEYKCGCKTIQYQKQNQKQNQNQITVIQKQQYCFKHLHYLKTKCILDEELTKINLELVNITRKENEI
jgi:hypothetical protein